MRMLQFYIVKSHLKIFFTITSFAGLIFLVCNALDAITRYEDLSTNAYLMLLVLKIPYLVTQIYPLIIVISTIFLIYGFAKTNQLVILVNAGISITKIRNLICSLNVLCGFFVIGVIGPIGSKMIHKHAILEIQLLKKQDHYFNKMQIFAENDGKQILMFKGIDLNNHKALNVTIISALDNQIVSRVDCAEAIFNKRQICGSSCNGTYSGQKIDNQDFNLETIINFNAVVDNASPVENLPVWRLWFLASMLAKLGMSYETYEIYLYKQLFKPLSAAIIASICFIHGALNRRSLGRKLLLTFGIQLFMICAIEVVAGPLLNYYNPSIAYSIILLTIMPIILRRCD